VAKSIDEKVTTDLIETLEDGRKGFEHAAERLKDSDRHDLSTRFETFSRQRADFSAELEKLAAAYGDDIDEDASIAAAVHRGWISLKDAISGADVDGVMKAALTGEEHAVSEYGDALDQDISAGLRDVVVRQLAAIEAARDEILALSKSTD
jgi:uncharacterized protein (TIGR02284 family)